MVTIRPALGSAFGVGLRPALGRWRMASRHAAAQREPDVRPFSARRQFLRCCWQAANHAV